MGVHVLPSFRPFLQRLTTTEIFYLPFLFEENNCSYGAVSSVRVDPVFDRREAKNKLQSYLP